MCHVDAACAWIYMRLSSIYAHWYALSNSHACFVVSFYIIPTFSLSLFLSHSWIDVLKEIARVGTSYIAQRRRARSCEIAWRTNSRPSSSVRIRTFSRLVIGELITAGLTDRPISGTVINSRCVKCVGSARIRVAVHVPASGTSLHEHQNGGHASRRRPSLYQVFAVRSQLPLRGLYRMRHHRIFFNVSPSFLTSRTIWNFSRNRRVNSFRGPCDSIWKLLICTSTM